MLLYHTVSTKQIDISLSSAISSNSLEFPFYCFRGASVESAQKRRNYRA